MSKIVRTVAYFLPQVCSSPCGKVPHSSRVFYIDPDIMWTLAYALRIRICPQNCAVPYDIRAADTHGTARCVNGT